MVRPHRGKQLGSTSGWVTRRAITSARRIVVWAIRSPIAVIPSLACSMRAAISDRLRGHMSPADYKPAISFDFGEAFPDTNPVAAFVVALSLAWKDLLYVNLRLVGGDGNAPSTYDVSDGEMRYL